MRTLKIACNNTPHSPQHNLFLFGSVGLPLHQDCDYSPVGPRRLRQMSQGRQNCTWFKNLFLVSGGTAEQPNRVKPNDKIWITPVLVFL